MRYRYALDQTFTKNQAQEFLKEVAEKNNIVAYGYYKGNGKTETVTLEYDAPKWNYIREAKAEKFNNIKTSLS